VRYQRGARGFSIAKNMQTETGIKKEFDSISPGVKQPGRETDNQRRSPKIKDQPGVTGVTVRIAVVVNDSCVFTFC
jgi:hypothetical protein